MVYSFYVICVAMIQDKQGFLISGVSKNMVKEGMVFNHAQWTDNVT